MLGDQTERAKGGHPLISVVRRRKTKTVTFAAPTYVDYSEYEYSSEEEIDHDPDLLQRPQGQQQLNHGNGQNQAQDSAEDDVEDETAKVEPLKPRSLIRDEQ